MKKILKENILWFALVFTLSAIIWNFTFSALDAPKDTEKLSVFVTAGEVDESYFTKKLEISQKIKKTTVYYREESARYFDEYFGTAGLINSDLLVIPSAMLDDNAMLACTLILNDEIIEKYGLDGCEFFTKDALKYGVTVLSETVDIFGSAVRYENDEESYVLIVNAASKNADINGNDNALKALKNLVKS